MHILFGSLKKEAIFKEIKDWRNVFNRSLQNLCQFEV